MHLFTRDADFLRSAIATGSLPSNLIRSITWDQGIEVAWHTDITADRGHPFAPGAGWPGPVVTTPFAVADS